MKSNQTKPIILLLLILYSSLILNINSKRTLVQFKKYNFKGISYSCFPFLVGTDSSIYYEIPCEPSFFNLKKNQYYLLNLSNSLKSFQFEDNYQFTNIEITRDESLLLIKYIGILGISHKTYSYEDVNQNDSLLFCYYVAEGREVEAMYEGNDFSKNLNEYFYLENLIPQRIKSARKIGSF